MPIDSNSLFPFVHYDKMGYIDRDGQLIIPLQCYEVNNFKEGLAKVNIDFYWRYIDRTGKIVITEELSYLNNLRLAPLILLSNCGLFQLKGGDS